MSTKHSTHADHESHSSQSKDPLFKPNVIGVYLGLLAVLIALCAVMGHTEQNLMTQAMVSQSRATSKEVAASVKYRLVLSELSQLGWLPKDQRDPKLVSHYLDLYKDYLKEREVAHELSEALDPSIESHFEATDEFELAQLIAEIAIAIASFSLILHNRYVWYVSVVFSVLSIAAFSYTKHHTGKANAVINKNISVLEKEYKDLRVNHQSREGDSLILSKFLQEPVSADPHKD